MLHAFGICRFANARICLRRDPQSFCERRIESLPMPQPSPAAQCEQRRIRKPVEFRGIVEQRSIAAPRTCSTIASNHRQHRSSAAPPRSPGHQNRGRIACTSPPCLNQLHRFRPAFCYSTTLFNGYSTIPVARAAFSFGITSRAHSLFHNRVHRHPLRIAQLRNRRRIQRGQHAPAPHQVGLFTFSISPTCDLRSNRPTQHQRQICSIFFRFHSSARRPCRRSSASRSPSLCR